MVHPQEDKNDALHQYRDQPRGPGTEAPPPYPGEIIGNKTPPFEVVGLDALSPILMHVEFPATRQEIVSRIGGARIPIDKSRTKTVSEILDIVGPTHFPSHREVEAAVQQVWDQVAEQSGRGGRHRQGDNLSGRPNL